VHCVCSAARRAARARRRIDHIASARPARRAARARRRSYYVAPARRLAGIRSRCSSAEAAPRACSPGGRPRCACSPARLSRRIAWFALNF
jgi:hypothetical protein